VIAALYVQEGGCYYGLDGVDPWPEARDARTYSGPWPVVAHPPCARWCRLAGLVEARYGIPRHQDGGCFAAALASVRRWGGVLEHPRATDAWPAHGLPRPSLGACCACSRAAAAAGMCHRVWAAEALARAGWRVVLDGVEVVRG